MIEAHSFDTAWLQARYRFDVAARSKEVEQQCLAHFSELPKLNIIDAASGMGNNFLYFFRKFDMDQHWTFFEEDPAISKNAIERIATFFRQLELEFVLDDMAFKVHHNGNRISVNVISESYKSIASFSDLQKVDLMMTNALFEKESPCGFEDFIGQFAEYKIPFLSTMNYAGMEFTDPEEPDAYYVRIYDEQLKKLPAFGNAMGKDCPNFMQGGFLKNGWQIETGETRWNISRHDIKMHYYMLNFIEDAVRSCNLDPLEIKAFDCWLLDKKNRSLSEDIEMTVYHEDIFAYF